MLATTLNLFCLLQFNKKHWNTSLDFTLRKNRTSSGIFRLSRLDFLSWHESGNVHTTNVCLKTWSKKPCNKIPTNITIRGQLHTNSINSCCSWDKVLPRLALATNYIVNGEPSVMDKVASSSCTCSFFGVGKPRHVVGMELSFFCFRFITRMQSEIGVHLGVEMSWFPICLLWKTPCQHLWSWIIHDWSWQTAFAMDVAIYVVFGDKSTAAQTPMTTAKHLCVHWIGVGMEWFRELKIVQKNTPLTLSWTPPKLQSEYS